MQIGTVTTVPQQRDALWQKAQQLEAAFLSEMLRHAGAQTEAGAFGGGIGEEQFSSFLRESQAKVIVENGGIGLARHLFDALIERAER